MIVTSRFNSNTTLFLKVKERCRGRRPDDLYVSLNRKNTRVIILFKATRDSNDASCVTKYRAYEKCAWGHAPACNRSSFRRQHS